MGIKLDVERLSDLSLISLLGTLETDAQGGDQYASSIALYAVRMAVNDRFVISQVGHSAYALRLTGECGSQHCVVFQKKEDAVDDGRHCGGA